MFEASLFSSEATVTTKVPEPPQPKSATEKVIVLPTTYPEPPLYIDIDANVPSAPITTLPVNPFPLPLVVEACLNEYVASVAPASVDEVVTVLT